jgi:hypothetical protein
VDKANHAVYFFCLKVGFGLIDVPASSTFKSYKYHTVRRFLEIMLKIEPS